MHTTRQYILQQLGHKIGKINFERFKAQEFEITQLYSTMTNSSFEGMLIDFYRANDMREYVDGLTDRAYKMLLNAIKKQSEHVKFINIDAMPILSVKIGTHSVQNAVVDVVDGELNIGNRVKFTTPPLEYGKKFQAGVIHRIVTADKTGAFIYFIELM